MTERCAILLLDGPGPDPPPGIEPSRYRSALADRRGNDGRDAVWGHPDLLPSADDLDDPEGFVTRSEGGGEGPTFPDLPPTGL